MITYPTYPLLSKWGGYGDTGQMLFLDPVQRNESYECEGYHRCPGLAIVSLFLLQLCWLYHHSDLLRVSCVLPLDPQISADQTRHGSRQIIPCFQATLEPRQAWPAGYALSGGLKMTYLAVLLG